MSIRPPLLATLATLAACAAPEQVRLREPVALHPLAAAPGMPAAGVAGDLPGPEAAAGEGEAGTRASADGRTADAGGGGNRGAAGTPALSATSSRPSLVPAGGEARADLVASAVRLLGIRGSFEERSFLGHVLRINDLLPAGAISASYGSAQALEAARARDLLRPGDGARIGDVAFFRCPGQCGDGGRGDPSAGIVESAGEGDLRLVCYVDGEVRRCVPGGSGRGDAVPVGALAGVADPFSMAAAPVTTPGTTRP